ncbi:hypothetical protein Tco_0774757 [Tanacetum coccineum]|uniref:Uncharacterized protein n=1 Tax=Tanacetum coccineum TaxID=301880 RepID=A0ABQ4ZS58_9ASTR
MEMWWWWDVVGVVEMKMKVVAARGGDGVTVTMVLVVYGATMGMAVVVCDEDGGDEGWEMKMMISRLVKEEGDLALRLPRQWGMIVRLVYMSVKMVIRGDVVDDGNGDEGVVLRWQA